MNFGVITSVYRDEGFYVVQTIGGEKLFIPSRRKKLKCDDFVIVSADKERIKRVGKVATSEEVEY